MRYKLTGILLSVAVGGALAAEPESDSWDVNQPPGEALTASIDTTTGTWLNVDVSPDGETIAFDLLGDIFTIPVGGGEAKQLTSGMAWDMQPRFSPDGSEIVFTSDRAGGDNIWRMLADGSEPQQVTDESFRLLNNPDWSPDGNYIVARKHFTKSRSLGSGEMWLYHKSGGSGVQLTEKPNDQKDVNDPAFSPDGRYLYFDQDNTAGGTFEYSKDSTGEIYVIKRLDRQTGEIIDYITGPGGAIRPTPSPDGKWLAFIRRHEYKTVLHLKNIESGEIIPIHDGLDRDNQEIWAIHGVYSNMAWLPDSKSIVFWADGKIKRIDITSQAVTDIPFRVKKEMELRHAIQRSHDPAPEEFTTKMLRFVSVSPDGRRVVFESLGKLWIRDVTNGEARRLTRQNEHFELYPAWSRDSRMIAYVTWDDEKLGSVRIVSANGGDGQIVTKQPGHFVEPAFSPDGNTLVYRRAQGGYITSPLWSENPGVYRKSLTDNSAEQLVSRSGSQPHFGSSNDRLFLFRHNGENRVLASVDLNGNETREHYTSTWADHFRVSPNGEWLAFRERFNVYITPFVNTGKAVAIGPDSKSLPLSKATRDAGDNLHWSGDSGSLWWSLGPELYQRDLADSFAFLSGAPETLPEPATEGIDLGFTAKADKPDSRIALVGARIITMNGDEVIENGTILVDSNRIVAVGRSETIDTADYTVVDASGKTIMPGIIDVHWHGSQGENEFVPETSWVNLASLAFGVTTIHDPSNDNSSIFAASELSRAGYIIAPRIWSTGRILYGATTSFTAEVNSLDDALSHLRRMKAIGAISVKSYNQPRREQRQQVLEAGRQLDLLVVPEGGALFQSNMTMIVDGHTGIEHSLPTANIYDDVVQLWSQSKVGYTPTLGVAYGGIMGERYWYQHDDVWKNERLMRWVPYEFVAPVARRRWKAPEGDYNHIDIARGVKQLHDAGVNIQLGAHGQREGLAAHWEMWMFEQGGMTPLEAIRAATLGGAKYLGMDKALGSLEAGKLADLVIMDNNPLESLRNTDSVSMVMVNGRLFDTATFREIHSGNRAAGKMYFH